MLKYVLGRLDFFAFFVVIFSLPFGKSVFVPILFGWLCSVFLSYFVNRDYSVDRFKGLLALPILFYLLHTIGVVQSANIGGGLFDMQLKLSLLLLPLLYPYQRYSYVANRQNFLWTFVFGCATATIYYFVYAIYRSYSVINGFWVFNSVPLDPSGNYFLGIEYSFLIHPSYLALYLLVALLIIGEAFARWKQWWFAIRIMVILLGLLLITSLIMLQSRAGILGFGLLVLVWLIYLVISKKRYIVGVSVLVVLFCLIYLVVNNMNRYSNTIKSLETTAKVGIKNQNKDDGTSVRIWIWKSAISVVMKNPILGVGTGDTRDELYKQYVENEMYNAIQMRFNAHNQYLETWLGIGIFGLLALFAMLFVPLWVGIKRRDWLLVGFICLCSVSFMFESMLNSIAGVGFFAIFYTILVSRSGLEVSGNAKLV